MRALPKMVEVESAFARSQRPVNRDDDDDNGSGS